eukprot:TRINITY_DN8885_c0_g1_i2.p3 TRINITY_DN8885_c0_g1~~TRINITY_DN8885_c0_g1_i2.p3  ORF type:complete len:118 (-),score=13.39 TRINITY_DN8885_c0_g1_i2:2069-2422(-)
MLLIGVERDGIIQDDHLESFAASYPQAVATAQPQQAHGGTRSHPTSLLSAADGLCTLSCTSASEPRRAQQSFAGTCQDILGSAHLQNGSSCKSLALDLADLITTCTGKALAARSRVA